MELWLRYVRLCANCLSEGASQLVLMGNVLRMLLLLFWFCVLFVAVLKILNVLLCFVKHGKLVVELVVELVVLQLK